MAVPAALQAHLDSGATTLCRCWALVRRDGAGFGFTDHDVQIAFGGRRFAPDAGLSAAAIQAGTGLAVDNTEAVGVLSDAGIREADILAGRYDGAEVTAWLVNWRAPEERMVLFRGTLGEVTRGAGAFRAELRSLAEALNRPTGRVYQAPCSAVLGDGECRFDLARAGFAAEAAVLRVEGPAVYAFAGLDGFDDRWFEAGRLSVLDGPAGGLVAWIKNDRPGPGGIRRVETWEELRLPLAAGDRVRLEAGCDKRAETCRLKFNNFSNFRGFPHVPGEDWLMSYPASGQPDDGGSLGR